jgi:hypothetical protein
LPVPDPIAAVVERRFGLAYRGHLLMREIGDSLPVLDFLGRRPDLDVVPLLAHGLRDLHDAGLWHPDLNLGNVLVVMRSYGASLAYVDLDRARLHDRPLGIAARRRSLRRLRRSAAKLDPAGRLLGAPALGRLEEMYWRLGPTSDAQVEESARIAWAVEPPAAPLLERHPADRRATDLPARPRLLPQPTRARLYPRRSGSFKRSSSRLISEISSSAAQTR